ncbi:MAG: TetR/AcrR family transcriptional regulator, partial [Bacilli bacterium]|nr:TetR/AcrR family transcriptional regulator [Bacilli bacterium]
MQILEAAQKVFIQNGYNGSTTLEIAKAANISEVTLFRYFSSKQEVFLEVIEPVLLQSLKETIALSKTLTPEEKLESVLIERIQFVSKNNQILALILKENTLILELGKDDLLNQFWLLFKDLLLELDFPIESLDFNVRLLMGSFLSFLFSPEFEANNI